MSYCTDFNGLLILAIGCNIVYIVKGHGANFFLFLDIIDSKRSFINNLLDTLKIPRIFETIKTIEEKQTLGKLRQTLGKNTEKIITEILKLNVSKMPLDSIDKKMRDAKKYFENLSRYKNTKNLQVIAFITFLYGFYISIFAPYESDIFNKSLLPMNIYIFVISFVCLLYDIYDREISGKRIFLLILPLVIYAIFFRIFDKNITDWLFPEIDSKYSMFRFIEIDADRFNLIFNYNYIFTVLMCFAGFLWHIASVIFGNILVIKYEFFMKDVKKIMYFEKYIPQLDKCVLNDIKTISQELSK